MRKRANVKLLPGWGDYSRDNPDGPPTFLRDRSAVPGPLQISIYEWVDGKTPNPSEDDLIKLAAETGDEQNFGELIKTISGRCEFGIYGSTVYRSQEYPRIQIWFISNGKDCIFATHICPEEPDDVEVDEAQQIVCGISLAVKPWWRFW